MNVRVQSFLDSYIYIMCIAKFVTVYRKGLYGLLAENYSGVQKQSLGMKGGV